MCIIIHSTKNPVEDSILMRSSTINPHGLGIIDLNTYQLTYHKSKDWKVLSGRTNYVAHFRYATIGEINKANMHPFLIPQSNCHLFQNGTVNSLGSTKITDAEDMAILLRSVRRDRWRTVLELTDCRWVIVDASRKSVEIYNEDQWHKYDGSNFSKDNVLPTPLRTSLYGDEEPHTVAVYGTLKQGGGNDHLLSESTYIDDGKTVEKYPMVSMGIPFVFDRPGDGHNIKVEVYSVSETVLDSLDRLEGHPDWYERRYTFIELMDGTIEEAWLYFCDGAQDTGNYIASHPITSSYYGNYLARYDKTECPKCNCSNTVYDDYANQLWCYDCDEHTVTRAPF